MTDHTVQKALSVLLAFACVATLGGCKKQEGFDHSHDDIAVYVKWMWFDTTEGQNNGFMDFYLMNGCDDIVLVASEAESGGYPEGVIVAWPSEETEIILKNLNGYTAYKDIDLALYSLTYPLTIEDALEHWEEILDLLDNGLTSSESNLVTDPSKQAYWSHIKE